ncbi:cysteine-rich receptor-like protein kinase 10 isoform X1 [Prosopis cineraria]|uniref:cysteine-rich receptor-like protein kinase 10 isoform X1 n=1 Tax=Prosopis cineraria TaxID=364024 RepID=UPI0024105F83|nr:cysteine-rich receptor-like protein kinase 10 isoform X1 [Prosopis cineraria]
MVNSPMLFLFLCTISFLSGVSLADPPYQNCSTSSNYTKGSSFQNNLNNILGSLSSNASISKSYNVSYGSDPDRVHAFFMCLDYVSNQTCQDCIASAAQDILKHCPKAEEAIVWEEQCQLRYSNKDFLGKVDVTGKMGFDNKLDISEPEKFEPVVNGLLYSLTDKVSFNVSSNLYAIGEAPFEEKTIYGLVQCTRDLSASDCNVCLKSAISHLPICCYSSIGARVLSRSCYLRFELYEFYNGALDPNDSSTKTSKSTTSKAGMIAGIITATGLGIVIFSCCLYFFTKKRTQKSKGGVDSHVIDLHSFGEKGQSVFQNHQNFLGRNDKISENLPYFDLETLCAATKNFSDSNKLGQGGFGSVYKGVLSDGQEVAIKRLSTGSEQGSDEFINEVLLILKLQHKNLVRLLGFCLDGEEMLLVYEFLPNGSLDAVLFNTRQQAQLSWIKRVDIIYGIARGILYLHEDSRLKIIHRDLKASNILLDYDMNPKISDFGMARIFAGAEGEANTATIVGTYGYMAPEYAMEGLYSIKSDVFGFGVLLLEIISGRRNAGFYYSKFAPSLLAYAWHLWNEGNALELMDPLLADSCPEDQFLKYMHVGLLCVQADAYDRPTMSSVVLMLKSQSPTLGQPQRPPFCVGKIISNDHNVPENEHCSVNNLAASDTLPQ